MLQRRGALMNIFRRTSRDPRAGIRARRYFTATGVSSNTRPRCLGNIATTQSQPHSVELARIPGRQVGRPGSIVFDQIDGDLSGILAFMDELF
jgi:hypothetical protein